MSENLAYHKTDLNSNYFSPDQDKLENYFKSTKYFLTHEYLKDNMSYLDIGGAVEKGVNSEGYKYFEPKTTFIIDDKEFDIKTGLFK